MRLQGNYSAFKATAKDRKAIEERLHSASEATANRLQSNRLQSDRLQSDRKDCTVLPKRYHGDCITIQSDCADIIAPSKRLQKIAERLQRDCTAIDLRKTISKQSQNSAKLAIAQHFKATARTLNPFQINCKSIAER